MRLMLALLIIAGLTLAPLAAAEGGHDAPRRHADARHAHHDNETNDSNETRKDGEKRGNSERFEAFRAAMAAFRQSWHENATKVREACHAQAPLADNATRAEHKAWAHCIHDGYHALFSQMRAERKEILAESRSA